MFSALRNSKNFVKSFWAMSVLLTVFSSPLYAADVLFAKYSLEETQGSTATDDIAGLNGTVRGTAQWGDGALTFNGSTDVLIETDNQPEALSFYAEFESPKGNGWNWIFAHGDNFGVFQSTDKLAIYYAVGNDWKTVYVDFSDDGLKHKIGGQWGSGRMKLFLDGNEVINTDMTSLTYTIGDNYTLGSMQHTRFYKGKIYEAHIYNGVDVDMKKLVSDTPTNGSAPVITLGNVTDTNSPDVVLVVGTPYEEYGATIVDAEDGTTSILPENIDRNTLATALDLEGKAKTPGDYTVIYRWTDSDENSAKAIRKVKIIEADTTGPVITILGENLVSVFVGDEYNDKGITAKDEKDGDTPLEKITTVITDNINADSVVAKIDTTKIGNYTITYTAEDNAGNKTTATRTVNIISDTEAPIIKLNGGSMVNVVKGTAYADAGATATDNKDATVTITTDPVDPNSIDTSVAPATYTIKYNAKDAAGNDADEVTRTVMVIAAPATSPAFAKYLLNETSGKTAEDSTDKTDGSEDGTIRGNADWKNGSLNFNGKTDVVIKTTNEQASLSFYAEIKAEDKNSWSWIFAHGDNFGVYLTASNKLRVYYYNPDNQDWPVVEYALQDPTAKHKIGAQWSKEKGMQLYIDGAQVINESMDVDLSYNASLEQGSDYTLGSMNKQRFFKGEIFEAHIYNGVDVDMAALTGAVVIPPPQGNTAPVIIVVPKSGTDTTVRFVVGDKYSEYGAKVADKEDGYTKKPIYHDTLYPGEVFGGKRAIDISKLPLDGNKLFTKAGEFTVTYNWEDLQGLQATPVTRMVIVEKPVDTAADAIEKIIAYAADSTSLAAPTVADYIAAGIGNNKLIEDNLGHLNAVVSVFKNRTPPVIITQDNIMEKVGGLFTDEIPPTMALNGGNETLAYGAVYHDKGATAMDNLEGNITNKVDNPPLSITFDTTEVGPHTVTYTVYDLAGNKATIDRIVTVNPQIPEGIAGLITPDGETTKRPDFTWTQVEGSQWYYIWVADANAEQNGPVISQWVKADACDATTKICTFTPQADLAVGAGKWWVRTWIDADTGDWSEPKSFTVSGQACEGRDALDALIATAKAAEYTDTAANNAVINADTSCITDMSNLFKDDKKFNLNITGWDVSKVTNMQGMFARAEAFNQAIGAKWEVSKVTDMSFMFNAQGVSGGTFPSAFNQPLNEWDVSSVTNMSQMFSRAQSFNQDLNNWDVSNVTNMSGMFNLIRVFNGNVTTWDVKNVTNMAGIFNGNEVFNQNISNWDVSKVTNMAYMLQGTYIFNQDISSWNVENVTDMSQMFRDARKFNQNISGWDVKNVTNMAIMFERAYAFNQDIKDWDVNAVTNMDSMFHLAKAFSNQDLSGWNVNDVVTHADFFLEAGAGNKSPWNVELPVPTSITKVK